MCHYCSRLCETILFFFIYLFLSNQLWVLLLIILFSCIMAVCLMPPAKALLPSFCCVFSLFSTIRLRIKTQTLAHLQDIDGNYVAVCLKFVDSEQTQQQSPHVSTLFPIDWLSPLRMLIALHHLMINTNLNSSLQILWQASKTIWYIMEN